MIRTLINIVFLSTILLLLSNSSAIDSLDNDFKYEVVQLYKPLSMAKTSLSEAEQVGDLHRQYKNEWVQDYLSVDIRASIDGVLTTATSPDQTLNKEQKQLMLSSEAGSEIEVVVNYIPKNTLRNKEPKKFDFSFMVNPEQDALYPGGQEKLLQDIKSDLIDTASWESLRQYQLAVVSFVIDTDGHIINPKIFWSSDDKETDAKMIDFVCNMPTWTPAQYATGQKAAQEFALTIGDNNSCVVPMLNTEEN